MEITYLANLSILKLKSLYNLPKKRKLNSENRDGTIKNIIEQRKNCRIWTKTEHNRESNTKQRKQLWNWEKNREDYRRREGNHVNIKSYLIFMYPLNPIRMWGNTVGAVI